MVGPPGPWLAPKPGYPPPVSLEIDHVTKRFGSTTALDGLTFEVGRGEVFGFLGANGAGKTTTMRICLGIVVADDGAIRWDGRPVGELPRRTWGYLPEERGLYPRMTVLDQLVYFGSLYGVEPREPAARRSAGWSASASPSTRRGAPRSCRRATSRRSSSSRRSCTTPRSC